MIKDHIQSIIYVYIYMCLYVCYVVVSQRVNHDIHITQCSFTTNIIGNTIKSFQFLQSFPTSHRPRPSRYPPKKMDTFIHVKMMGYISIFYRYLEGIYIYIHMYLYIYIHVYIYTHAQFSQRLMELTLIPREYFTSFRYVFIGRNSDLNGTFLELKHLRWG